MDRQKIEVKVTSDGGDARLTDCSIQVSIVVFVELNECLGSDETKRE